MNNYSMCFWWWSGGFIGFNEKFQTYPSNLEEIIIINLLIIILITKISWNNSKMGVVWITATMK